MISNATQTSHFLHYQHYNLIYFSTAVNFINIGAITEILTSKSIIITTTIIDYNILIVTASITGLNSITDDDNDE